MKRLSILALALTAALGLSGCAERAAALENGKNDPNSASGLAAALTAGEENTVIDEDGFEHKLFEGENIVEHDPYGYCGNTQTTITRNTRMGGEPAKKTFMFSDSVALTDLLRWLDYSEQPCKCLPEYYVKTEFGEEPYEVNLSEGYVRFNGGQVSLTAEQLGLIRDIINRQLK